MARKRKVRKPYSSALESKKITMVTIHRRRPRGYWVRVWHLIGGCSLPKETHHRTSLRSARAMIPDEMQESPRTLDDAQDLVEVWA